MFLWGGGGEIIDTEISTTATHAKRIKNLPRKPQSMLLKKRGNNTKR